jgi:hypothetical protein
MALPRSLAQNDGRGVIYHAHAANDARIESRRKKQSGASRGEEPCLCRGMALPCPLRAEAATEEPTERLFIDRSV